MAIKEQILFPIREGLSEAKLLPIVNKAGLAALDRIVDRTTKGKFLGGPYANRGYSTRDISTFVLGRSSKYLPRKKALDINRFGLGKVRASESDLKWRETAYGNTPFLIGGYRRFRQLAGLQTNVVNLSLTGRMLGSMFVDTKVLRGSTVRVDIRPTRSQSLKARFTDAKRNWLGLSDTEINGLMQYVSRELDI